MSALYRRLHGSYPEALVLYRMRPHNERRLVRVKGGASDTAV
jgi:hypothetical protein